MCVYVNHHAEAVRLFGPAPDLHLYDEGFLLAPGGSVEFNATDDDWLTVRVDDGGEPGEILEAGYVSELAEYEEAD
jgi:hypothetical protein